ncbi:hypothetical protein EPUL_006638, partial [Erysiphe pulchra]
MSTLRQVAKGREVGNFAQVAMTPKGNRRGGGGHSDGDNDPDAICKICKHKHRNKNCFKQRPELRRNIKNKGKAKVTFENSEIDFSSDSHSDNIGLSAVARASYSKSNNYLLYDTGASHHFMRKKTDFLFLKKLRKPFEFDQAVGNSNLSYKGNCRVKIGTVTLELSDVLYSPKSSCDILSAVRLKEDYGIVAANQNEILIDTNAPGSNMPIAKLISIDG